MGGRRFIFIALVLSLAIHLLLIKGFSLKIDAKDSPVVYCWPEILSSGDLFTNNRDIDFPPGVNFSSDRLARRCFAKEDNVFLFLDSEPHILDASAVKNLYSGSYLPRHRDHQYLWGKSIVFDFDNQEKVPYSVFVSERGKVVFSYPRKLALNSQGSIYTQEYIREAALFFNHKFAWTKLEEVIQ